MNCYDQSLNDLKYDKNSKGNFAYNATQNLILKLEKLLILL